MDGYLKFIQIVDTTYILPSNLKHYKTIQNFA